MTLAETVYLIAALIVIVPFVVIVQKVNDDKVKRDAAEYAQLEAERRQLKAVQEFDKF